MEATIVYRGSIGIMEKKMQTTIVYRGYIGAMERKWKHLGKGHRKVSGLFRPLRNSESGEVLCWRMVPFYKTSALQQEPPLSLHVSDPNSLHGIAWYHTVPSLFCFWG